MEIMVDVCLVLKKVSNCFSGEGEPLTFLLKIILIIFLAALGLLHCSAMLLVSVSRGLLSVVVFKLTVVTALLEHRPEQACR